MDSLMGRRAAGQAATVSQSPGRNPGGARGGIGSTDESRRGTAASWPSGWGRWRSWTSSGPTGASPGGMMG